MYTIVLVNVKRFRALCGFYAIENKLLLLLLFKYLGSAIGENGGCEEEARHRVGVASELVDGEGGERCQE